MSRNGKWIVLPLGLALLLFTATLVYYSVRASGEERTCTVQRATISRSARGIGKVEGENDAAQLGFTLPGRLRAVKVTEGQTVQAGDVLAELDPAELDLQVAAGEAALKEARAHQAQVERKPRPEELAPLDEQLNRAALEVKAARERLEQLDNPAAPPPAAPWQVQVAALEVLRAANLYNEALFARDRLLKQPTKHDLGVAEAQVDLAKVDWEDAKERVDILKRKAYWDYAKEHEQAAMLQNIERMKAKMAVAQAEHDRVKRGPTEEEKKAAEAHAQSARAGYDEAVAAKERLEKPPTPVRASAWELEAAKNVLAKAQAAEREAKAGLDLLKAGPPAADIEAARASAEKAEKALEQTRQRREQTVLRAPCAGTVVGRFCEPGATPPPYAPVIALADLHHLRVRAEIPVHWSAELKEGQEAELSCKAIFGETLNGKITRVMDLITPKSLFSRDPSESKGGEVSVALIQLDEKQKTSTARALKALRPGLRLDVTVNFETRANVLCVPRSFVVVEDGKPVVYRSRTRANLNSALADRINVELGFRDDLNVEISAGLEEGDVLFRPSRAAHHGTGE